MWMETMRRINAVIYVTVHYNKVLSSVLYFLTSQSKGDFGISLVFGIFVLKDDENTAAGIKV